MKPLALLGILAAIALAISVSWHLLGNGDWDRNRTEIVTTQSGETVVITGNGWHGPPFGFFLIPLIVFGLIWVFVGRKGRVCDSRDVQFEDRAQLWSDWHRAEHERIATSGRPESQPPA